MSRSLFVSSIVRSRLQLKRFPGLHDCCAIAVDLCQDFIRGGSHAVTAWVGYSCAFREAGKCDSVAGFGDSFITVIGGRLPLDLRKDNRKWSLRVVLPRRFQNAVHPSAANTRVCFSSAELISMALCMCNMECDESPFEGRQRLPV